MIPVVTRCCKGSLILRRAFRMLTRSFYRRVFVLFSACVVLFVLHFLSAYFVDFYLPTMQEEPKRRDMSHMAILKGQEYFISTVLEPEATTQNLHILVLINSAAHGEAHCQKRMAIRRTWGKPTDDNRQWRTIFFLGKTFVTSVDEKRVNEGKKYGDMIIGDLADTYRNITHKLMMAFYWASKQGYSYLLKTDDDVYINIPSLMTWIGRRTPTELLYAGVLYRARVIRDHSHRHFVTWHDLPWKLYPWYPKGAMYVLSSSIVKDMVRIANKVKMITVDDAYVGVLAWYLGVKPIRLHGFIQWNFVPNLIELFDKCTYINIFGFADNLTPDDIYFVHQEVTSYRNSSNWMCIHIYHPVVATIVLIILIIAILYMCLYKIVL